jgi:thioredoxin-related protein
MKTYILVVVLLLGTTTLFAQSINWVSMDEALAMQQKAPKKILIDMYTSWCGPCKMLDRNTFTNKDLIAYVNKHYYAVKFNAEGNEVVNFKDQKFTNPNYNPEMAKRRNSSHQFTRYLGVRAYPTMVYLGLNAEVIAPIPGYQTAQQMELYLKLFKDDAYKQMNTQEAFNNYYQTFVPSFTPY